MDKEDIFFKLKHGIWIISAGSLTLTTSLLFYAYFINGAYNGREPSQYAGDISALSALVNCHIVTFAMYWNLGEYHSIPKKILGFSVPHWKVWAKWLAIFAPIMLAANLINMYTLNAFSGVPFKDHIVISFINMTSPFYLKVLTFFLVAGTAPLCEETIFRGFMFPYLERKISYQWAALISSALFSIAHMNIRSLFPLFVFGYILALIYKETRSLWLVIFLHSINNAAAMYLALMYR